jgi:hypothetical protein
MTQDYHVVAGEYLNHVHMTIANLIIKGNTQTKFVERQKRQNEKKTAREHKKRIKHAKLRSQEQEEVGNKQEHEQEENKQEQEEEENKQEQEEEEEEEEEEHAQKHWSANLWPCIAEALGNDYQPTITPTQQVWVIDEGPDKAPVIYPGNAMESQEIWTENGVSQWEVEFRMEKNRTKYPLWSIFTMRKDALTVLKLLKLRK